MNKNQIVFIVGMTIAGVTGAITTWYTGKHSYSKGVKDGIEIMAETIKLRDDLIENNFRRTVKTES